MGNRRFTRTEAFNAAKYLFDTISETEPPSIATYSQRGFAARDALKLLVAWFYEGTMELRNVEETGPEPKPEAAMPYHALTEYELRNRLAEVEKRLGSLAGLVETLDKSDNEDDKRIKRLEGIERCECKRINSLVDESRKLNERFNNATKNGHACHDELGKGIAELRDSLEAHVLKTAGLMRSMDDTVMDQVELQRVVDTQSRLIRDLYELTGKPSRYAFPLTTFVKRPVGAPCCGPECKKDPRPDADDRAMDTLRTDHEAAMPETDAERVANAPDDSIEKVANPAKAVPVSHEDHVYAVEGEPVVYFEKHKRFIGLGAPRLTTVEKWTEAMRLAMLSLELKMFALPSPLKVNMLHPTDMNEILKKRDEIIGSVVNKTL